MKKRFAGVYSFPVYCIYLKIKRKMVRMASKSVDFRKVKKLCCHVLGGEVEHVLHSDQTKKLRNLSTVVILA